MTGEVLRQLQAAGLVVEQLDTSGTLVRVPTETDRARKRSGWYVVHELRTTDGRTLYFGSYGNWKSGESGKLAPAKRGLSAEERARIDAQMRADRAAAQKAREELAETAARRAERIWAGLPESGASAYLDRKRVRAFGVRFTRGQVVVPLRSQGRLVGLQFIGPDGDKKFLTGTAKAGACHWVGDPQGAPVLAVAEGYATAASVHQATGWPCAVAFDAGNLLPVVERIRPEFPEARLVVAADDDHATPGNPGRSRAEECVRRGYAVAAYPCFAGEPGTDFNDLHVAEGLEAVARCLRAALEGPRPQGALREAVQQDAPERSALGGEDAAGSSPVISENSWEQSLRRTKNGDVKPDIANVVAILANDTRWAGVLGYCAFSYRVLKLRPPPFRDGEAGEWTDTDTTRVRVWLSERWGCTPSVADAHEAVVLVAQMGRFHPVRDWLESIMWDERPRVDGWLSRYLGAEDTPYTRAVGRYWLIGAVARAMRAPVKVDCVLILEGAQGLGKSTALQVLGGQWYSDTHFQLGEKDGYAQMQGVWICELSELDSFNKAESTRAKQFFAQQEDRYRPHYGRVASTFPRQCVFAGTTNQDSYLRDHTGNRRYWPVRCTALDAVALRRDREQLWAEAVQEFLHGARWWPGESDAGIFHEEQEQRYQADAWEDVLREYLMESTTDNFTVAELAKQALKLETQHLKPPEEQRIGRVMARLGWHKSRPRVQRNGAWMRLWVFRRPTGWGADEAA